MVRVEAARSLIRFEGDEDLLVAAFAPSDRVYWVSEAARPILAQVTA